MTENYIVAEESSRKSGGKKRKEKNLAPWLDTRNCLSPCENYTRVYVLDSCGRTRERGKGKKRSENVRRGWRTGEKAGEYRLDSRKGLSTFSHDTICCRHLTDNASAGAKYVFQLYLFPLSFSLRRGLFAKLPDHRGIPRVCNCVRGCLSLELFLDWSQQCLLRRERVETTGWRRVRGRETIFSCRKGVKIYRNFYT